MNAASSMWGDREFSQHRRTRCTRKVCGWNCEEGIASGCLAEGGQDIIRNWDFLDLEKSSVIRILIYAPCFRLCPEVNPHRNTMCTVMTARRGDRGGGADQTRCWGRGGE